MIKGLKMSLAVDVKGTIVRSNSPFVVGNRVTLMEMDFDKLLTNETKFKELAALDEKASLEEAKRIVKDLPGFKVTLDPEIQIEFK